MSAKAAIEIRDVIHVWIEFRAPKKGELMWSVPADASPAEALDHVVCGRDDWATATMPSFSSGECGFGCRVHQDMPEFAILDADDEDLPTRNIVVHVEWLRTEPQLNNVIPYIKLL